jgi:hypothetical protein
MDDHATPSEPRPGASPRRLFLFEKEWRIEVMPDGDREFCSTMAPGEDYYHRLSAGELYLTRDDEKICLACAERRGLLSFAPRTLAERIGIPLSADFETDPHPLA